MPLPTTGAISLAQVQAEFGGTNPISLSEYYGRASGVPTSGAISLGNFRGTSAFTTTHRVGVANGYDLYYGVWFEVYTGGGGGSVTPSTINGVPSKFTIAEIYWYSATSTYWMTFYDSVAGSVYNPLPYNNVKIAFRDGYSIVCSAHVENGAVFYYSIGGQPNKFVVGTTVDIQISVY